MSRGGEGKLAEAGVILLSTVAAATTIVATNTSSGSSIGASGSSSRIVQGGQVPRSLETKIIGLKHLPKIEGSYDNFLVISNTQS